MNTFYTCGIDDCGRIFLSPIPYISHLLNKHSVEVRVICNCRQGRHKKEWYGSSNDIITAVKSHVARFHKKGRFYRSMKMEVFPENAEEDDSGMLTPTGDDGNRTGEMSPQIADGTQCEGDMTDSAVDYALNDDNDDCNEYRHDDDDDTDDDDTDGDDGVVCSCDGDDDDDSDGNEDDSDEDDDHDDDNHDDDDAGYGVQPVSVNIIDDHDNGDDAVSPAVSLFASVPTNDSCPELGAEEDDGNDREDGLEDGKCPDEQDPSAFMYNTGATAESIRSMLAESVELSKSHIDNKRFDECALDLGMVVLQARYMYVYLFLHIYMCVIRAFIFFLYTFSMIYTAHAYENTHRFLMSVPQTTIDGVVCGLLNGVLPRFEVYVARRIVQCLRYVCGIPISDEQYLKAVHYVRESLCVCALPYIYYAVCLLCFFFS
eukprot:Rmarinus@m.2092